MVDVKIELNFLIHMHKSDRKQCLEKLFNMFWSSLELE